MTHPFVITGVRTATLVATLSALCALSGVQAAAAGPPRVPAHGAVSVPVAPDVPPGSPDPGRVVDPVAGRWGVLDASAPSRISRQSIAVSSDATASATTLSAPSRTFTAVRTSPGSAFYSHTARGVDTVVQQLPDGGRILEVLHGAGASRTFDYHVTTARADTLLPQEDGSIIVGRDRVVGDTHTTVATGTISAAWALDARGRPVRARYVVSGHTVRMIVSPTAGTTFPVVADPAYSRGGFRVSWSRWNPLSVDVRMNKHRSQDVADSKSVLCIGIAFVPVVGPAIAAVCGVSAILDNIVYRYGWCSMVHFNLFTRQVSFSYYRGGFCR